MGKKILYILVAIIISIVGFWVGLIVGQKIIKFHSSNQKALALETINIANDEMLKEALITHKENKTFNEDDFLPPEQKVVIDKKEESKKIKPKDPDCSNTKIEYEDMSLLAVGQNTALPDETYIPKNLKKINNLSSTKNDLCLTEEALTNFENLTKKAREDGYNIKASSAFRSYDLQKIIMTNAIANGNKNASIAIAKPGYSEHQLGTAVDITGGSINYSSASGRFSETEEAKWLEKYAGDYGFVESYPLGKEDITGYMYEPWHYRYIGIENAKQLLKNEQTINQFLK